jgi:putative hydrolase of the HAD superfamily
MDIKCIFFDLDGTLYPASTGLWLAIKQRIDCYLQTQMHFSPEQAQTIRQNYLEKYGTTLRGLQMEHKVDVHAYLDFVHDLPIEQYLHPDPELVQLIRTLKIPKWIFTNSDRKHALRILSFLGLENEFEGIIDIHALNYICKPQPEAYHTAIKIANQSQPGNCLFIDDSPVNIKCAKTLGFLTVFVSDNGNHAPADHTVNHLDELPRLYPDLWSLRARSITP